MQHNMIRVRFAPSPTGHLHVGGLRSAYFNWLFARHYGGTFLIRIEDTDPLRSTQEYMHSQLESLNWCGISSDEPLVIQSERLEIYKKIAHELVASGKAYRCYCTPTELETRLGPNAADGTGYSHYDGKCRAGIDQPDKPYAIRFKLPESCQEVIVDDLIRGQIVFTRDTLDDFIILRSDNYPMYNFSVVIDDAYMRITHIIRGEEHLVNTPKQWLLYDALYYAKPACAHLPLIFSADGTKLSKRDAAVSVIEYKKMGYLPQALCNYLVRLGWSHGDQEIFTKEELIRLFTLEEVGKKGSIFDLIKLTWMNGVFLRQKSAAELVTLIVRDVDREWTKKFISWDIHQLTSLIDLYKSRTDTLKDLMEKIEQLYYKPTSYELTVGSLNSEQKMALEELSNAFAGIAWDRATIEQKIKDTCQHYHLKLSQVAPPLRVALTGTSSSPAIYDIVYLLGQEAVLKRLQKFLGTTGDL